MCSLTHTQLDDTSLYRLGRYHLTQLHTVITTAKHMECHSVSTFALYGPLPYTHCNGSLMIVCTHQNMQPYSMKISDCV
jgi:hypothetical protein